MFWKKQGREQRPDLDEPKKKMTEEAPASSAPLPSDDQIEKSLTAIYEGQPSKEWMNTLERGGKRIWIMMLGMSLFFALIICAVAWVGFWWFGSRGFDGKGIELQIEGPKDISIGQEVSYRINWFNVTREPLASTEFRVSFPNDFKITSVDPSPTSEPLIFRLGAQPVEGRGTIKVSGVFTGSIGTKSVIQVVTTYRPSSYNSDFEGLSSFDIAYANSVLLGTLNVPSDVVPGDKVALEYTVTNSGSKRMDDIMSRFVLPDGFSPAATSTSDDPNTKEYFIPIGSLDAGASTSVRVYGSFAARSGGEQKMIAESGFSLAGGEFVPAQRTEAPISVMAGDLDLEVVVNGSQDDRKTAFGEWQRIAISYQNLSGQDLKDVILALRIEPQYASGTVGGYSLVDWSKMDDPGKGIRKGNVLTYTSKEMKELGTIEKGADGMIEVSVPMIGSATSGHDVPLSIYAEATVGKVGKQKVNRIIETKPISLRLQSDVGVKSEAFYTSEEGAPVGSGPLPPVVGSSTTYRVQWTLSKTLHALSRLQISAMLPSSAVWVGQREVGAGDVQYDEDKKLITWTINKMPEDVGDLLLSFDVSLIPTESDLGRFGQLLGETRMEFTDDALGQSMIRTAPAVTTDLPDDQMAARKGVVGR